MPQPSWHVFVGSAAAAAACLCYLWRRRSGEKSPPSWRTLPRPPTKSMLGMAGDILSAGPEGMTLLEEWSEKVEGGSYVGTVGGDVWVFLADAEEIRKVLLATKKFQIKMRTWRKEPGLLLAQGDRWRLQRRTTTPFFNDKQTTAMVGAFARTARSLRESVAGASRSVDIGKYMNRATLEVLFATTMSTQLSLIGNSARDADSPYLVLGQNLLETMGKLLESPQQVAITTKLVDLGLQWLARLLAPRFNAMVEAWDKLDRLCEDAVLDRKAKIERGEAPKDNKGWGDMLDAIRNLEQPWWGGALSVMVMAGTETTAWSTSWALYRLALHPEEQSRARAEVRAFVREAGGLDEALTPESFAAAKLPFLESCMLETLRLHPIADGAITAQDSLEDFEAMGRSFPAGSTVIVLYKVAMKREMKARFGWEDIDDYRPARWLGADGSVDREKERSLLTFGAGPRVCPGAQMARKQMMVQLASLLSEFDAIRFDEALSGPGGCRVKQELRTTIQPGNLHLIFDTAR